MDGAATSLLSETVALRRLVAPMRAGKCVRVVGPGNAEPNRISGANADDEAVWSLHERSAPGTTRDVRGVDHLSRRELVAVIEVFEAASGVGASCCHLPLALSRLVRTTACPVDAVLAPHFDFVLDEHRRVGNLVSDESEHASWGGRTRMAELFERWVAVDAQVWRLKSQCLATGVPVRSC